MEKVDIDIFGEMMTLDSSKVVFWVKKSMLLISDLHLGKVAHFRKNGLPVPSKAGQINFEKMDLLIQRYKPRRLVFLGDLFHSNLNSEWLSFKAFIKDHPALRFELVIGNHDIFDAKQYTDASIILHDPYLEEAPILFSHHPIDDLPPEWYNICGHIHPAIQLRGKGRQSIKMPCFYFGKAQGILPAFGAFTGTARILPEKGDQVWGILDGALLNFETE